MTENHRTPHATLPAPPFYRHIPIAALDGDALLSLSRRMKLSLSREDMLQVQAIFTDWGREPTDVELEVIAQTWSEHCKHRIFGATITHTGPEGPETIRSLFKTFIKDMSERVFARKPGFVISAFHDNAGFIRLDDQRAVCLKVETHNHPSAIEPYAGANTGLGGVIRDILGAGRGAKPIGSLDVFCFGPPDVSQAGIRGEDVIHPLGIMRGVVRGVRDYGNRMGIPTVSGAIQFDDAYIYNPLVFCGTAGVIAIKDIPKEVLPGQLIIAVGGRTGRDGLKGATFSSAALDTDSHAEDQQAVQIGNPIEEKKAADFVLAARDAGLIGFITDCGAGGFSSACGEMLSEGGGEIILDNAPLKEPGLISWEVFISESQERMVLSAAPGHLEALQALADLFETELTVLGKADGSGILKVRHHGEMVCELDCGRLHDAPVRHLRGHFTPPTGLPPGGDLPCDPPADLRRIFSDFAVVSREPIIREYDHEVQGNTVLKPLAGASGDAPQDAAVLRIDGSHRLMAMTQALLPEWGKTDPKAMGRACVDECFRQLVAAGADPDRIALLDNFCVGNPEDPDTLGALVESVKGLSALAEAYGAPFVSGKDSFYNYFETDDGPVSIPLTVLISGMGIVEDASHVTGASLRRPDSVLCVLGKTSAAMGGSIFARTNSHPALQVADFDHVAALERYRRYHQAVTQGWILSAHDIGEGGLAVALAEMAFSGKGGIEVSLDSLPVEGTVGRAARLFAETPGRLILEVSPGNLDALTSHFAGTAFATIGRAAADPSRLCVDWGDERVLNEDLAELKSLWKNGLTPYY